MQESGVPAFYLHGSMPDERANFTGMYAGYVPARKPRARESAPQKVKHAATLPRQSLLVYAESISCRGKTLGSAKF